MTDRGVEDLLRRLAPQILGAVTRRYGRFDVAEDATQEALLAAATRWPVDGVPNDPQAWLITVAARRLTDLLRSESARVRREDAVERQRVPWRRVEPAADRPDPDTDDTLVLLFLCCHPELSAASQIALTLRAVGGLTTAEIARAFLVPEATMTRRITRAKRTIAASGVPFTLPVAAQRSERLAAVLHVLYLIFNEGYASLARTDLAAEAIRLTRQMHAMLPDDSEVTGLLALMLLTDARRAARTGPDGELVPMDEQDRSRWDTCAIDEGLRLVAEALPNGPAGTYQLQAAIAALHDEAPTAEETDWAQILALYGVLQGITDNPVVALNHAVAVAMVHGPAAGLERLAALDTDVQVRDDHRLHAARAHLLERSGDAAAAVESYRAAAARASNTLQRRYLHARAARLTG